MLGVLLLLVPAHSGDLPRRAVRRLAIVGTAEMRGGLKSGFGGCHHEYGGLARLAKWFDGVRSEAGGSLITLDAGDFVRGHWAEGDNVPLARMMAATMGRLGYDAWTPGEAELALGMDHLLEFSTSIDRAVVSANLLDQTGRPFLPSYRIRTVTGIRIALTGITDPELVSACSAPEAARIAADFRFDDPAVSLARIVTRLRPEADLIVVLAHATPERARAITGAIPGIDLVVVGHRWREPTMIDTAGGATLVGLPAGGRSGCLVSIDLDAMNRPLEVVPTTTMLGSCRGQNPFPVDEDIARDIEAFERRQAAEYRVAMKERSESSAVRQANAYLGAEVCARCHPAIDRQWREGSHARALESLIRVGREHDTECLPCHVTAWEEPGGYTRFTMDDFDVERERRPDARPTLAGIQCEACHGQGTHHGTQRMVTRVPEEACKSCHDEANDPDFDYAKALAGGFHHQ
jgi:hypothetical protein